VNSTGGYISADLGDSSHDTRERLLFKENVLWAEVGRGFSTMLDNRE